MKTKGKAPEKSLSPKKAAKATKAVKKVVASVKPPVTASNKVHAKVSGKISLDLEKDSFLLIQFDRGSMTARMANASREDVLFATSTIYQSTMEEIKGAKKSKGN